MSIVTEGLSGPLSRAGPWAMAQSPPPHKCAPGVGPVQWAAPQTPLMSLALDYPWTTIFIHPFSFERLYPNIL